jgi:PAS domain-containing protein
MDLSKLTADEQKGLKKARARQYSASARQRQVDRERNLRDQVETSSIFQILIEAVPDAVLLLSADGRARILFVNDQSSHLLWLGSLGARGQALVGRSLWEWMDAQDKAAVVAAIGVCIFCKNATRRVQCTLYGPRPLFALQPGGAMQQLGNMDQQHHQQQWRQEQKGIRADLTFHSSERGLVVFMRPDKTEGKGCK